MYSRSIQWKILMLAGAFLPCHAFAYKIVSYNGKFTRWYQPTVHYTVDSRGSKSFASGYDGNGPHVSERQVMANSFQTWADTPGVKLNFIEDPTRAISRIGNDGVNAIRWIKTGWRNLDFSPPSNALAVTVTTYKTSNMEIIDSDTTFNDEYFTWAVIDSPEEEQNGVVDIQNIATHELGHFIGMDHSSENFFEPTSKLYLATMFFASGPGETFRRDLDTDDEDAGVTLYPEIEEGLPSIERVSPDTIDAASGGPVAVQILGSNFVSHALAQLVVPGDRGDLNSQVISVSPTEMNVAFNASTMPSGTFNLMIANTFDRTDQLPASVTITGGTGTLDGSGGTGIYQSTDGGGCSIAMSKSPSAGSGILFLLSLGLLGIIRRRSLRQRS